MLDFSNYFWIFWESFWTNCIWQKSYWNQQIIRCKANWSPASPIWLIISRCPLQRNLRCQSCETPKNKKLLKFEKKRHKLIKECSSIIIDVIRIFQLITIDWGWNKAVIACRYAWGTKFLVRNKELSHSN